jgi:hypothetical protein
MADRILFLSWGEVVRGREERAVEVFNESVGFYGRMQQEGRIEGFDVAFLTPHGTGLNGYFTISGSAQQLADLQEDMEFRRLQVSVGLIVDDLRIVDGLTGEGIAREMEIFTSEVAKVPQTA